MSKRKETISPLFGLREILTNSSPDQRRQVKAKKLNNPKEKIQNNKPKKKASRKRKLNKENDIPDDIKAKLAEINDIDENYELHVVKCSKVVQQDSFLSPSRNDAPTKLIDSQFIRPTEIPLKLPSAIGTSTPSLVGKKDRRPVPAELSKIDGSYENQMFEISHRSKNDAKEHSSVNHGIFLEDPIMSQEFSKKFQPSALNSIFSTESANSRIEISRNNIVEPIMLSKICSINKEHCAKDTSGKFENLSDLVNLDQNSILLRSRRVIYFENSRSRNPSSEDMFNHGKSGDCANIRSKPLNLSDNWAEEVSRQLSLKDRSHILRQYANVNRRLTRRTTRERTSSYGYSTKGSSHHLADKSPGNENRCLLSLEKICSPVLLSEEAHAIMPFEEIESPNVNREVSNNQSSSYVTTTQSNSFCAITHQVEQANELYYRDQNLFHEEVSTNSINLSVVSHATNMTCKSTTRLMSRLSLSEACSPYFKEHNSFVRKNFCDPTAVVYAKCGQPDGPMTWSEVFSPRMLSESVKIGEGTYGEVFLITNDEDESVAIKVVPIEGDFSVNDEAQKTYEEILPEILIATEMSNLREAENNRAPNYLELKSVSCIQGAYPIELLRAWDEFKKNSVSENDRPDVFNGTQLFIVFQFGNGGVDLEKINFKSVQEAKSIIVQLVLALAVAENALQFEHRDLHIGNVLVKQTEESTLTYFLNRKEIQVQSCGVQAFIIDFTNSRLSKDGITIFTDLSTDDALFNGEGDYQFEVYRLMKHINGNKWKHFEPQTNLLWLIYLLDKFVQFKKYKNRKMTKKQASTLEKMREVILSHASTQDIVNGDCNCSFINEFLL